MSRIEIPCCGPTADFQSTFALVGSEIGTLVEGVSDAGARRIGQLELKLDRLRKRLAIPGFSAAIVKDQRLLWARGFGCADIASGAPATP